MVLMSSLNNTNTPVTGDDYTTEQGNVIWCLTPVLFYHANGLKQKMKNKHIKTIRLSPKYYI